MKKRTKQVAFGAGIVVLLTLLGFLREFVFENINFQIYKLWYGAEEYSLPPALSFFNSWEADSLYNLKFPLTLLAILLYFGIAHVTVRFYFKERKMLLLNLGAHVLFCVIGGGFFAYGLIFDQYDQGYHFSRIFLDFVQSPLLLMIVLPACKLLENKEK